MGGLSKLTTVVAVAALLLLTAGVAAGDPCLVVYPNAPCIYHYSPTEYYAVGPGEPGYDPDFDRGGHVLLTAGSGEIDLSIYQAAQLAGFVADAAEQGFSFEGERFDLVIDGFANEPTTFVNVLLVFDQPRPAGCVPQITVDGTPVAGATWAAGDLVVSTPTATGNNYSDVVTHRVAWTGCEALHVWAFSDLDHDGTREGRECFTAFSHDLAVPATTEAWGRVKATYR